MKSGLRSRPIIARPSWTSMAIAPQTLSVSPDPGGPATLGLYHLAPGHHSRLTKQFAARCPGHSPGPPRLALTLPRSPGWGCRWGQGHSAAPRSPSPSRQRPRSARPYLCTWASTATPRSPAPGGCSTLTTVSRKVTLILRSTERWGGVSGQAGSKGQTELPCQAAGCCLRPLPCGPRRGDSGRAGPAHQSQSSGQTSPVLPGAVVVQRARAAHPAGTPGPAACSWSCTRPSSVSRQPPALQVGRGSQGRQAQSAPGCPGPLAPPSPAPPPLPPPQLCSVLTRALAGL